MRWSNRQFRSSSPPQHGGLSRPEPKGFRSGIGHERCGLELAARELRPFQLNWSARLQRTPARALAECVGAADGMASASEILDCRGRTAVRHAPQRRVFLTNLKQSYEPKPNFKHCSQSGRQPQAIDSAEQARIPA